MFLLSCYLPTPPSCLSPNICYKLTFPLPHLQTAFHYRTTTFWGLSLCGPSEICSRNFFYMSYVTRITVMWKWWTEQLAWLVSCNAKPLRKQLITCSNISNDVNLVPQHVTRHFHRVKLPTVSRHIVMNPYILSGCNAIRHLSLHWLIQSSGCFAVTCLHMSLTSSAVDGM